MKNEEAIAWLNTDDFESAGYAEAIRLAINALEQQKVGYQIPVIDTWGDEVTTVGGYKCSICGNFDGMKTKYCCECGAKMEENK